MSLSALSLVGVAALGAGVAAGLSALIVVAVAGLVAVALANAIRLLGQLLEAVDDDPPTVRRLTVGGPGDGPRSSPAAWEPRSPSRSS